MAPETIDSLSKDELKSLVLELIKQNKALAARLAELEAERGGPPKTPKNSSLPPSKGQKSNTPEPPAGTEKKKRKSRPGVARKLAETPDVTRDIYAGTCKCGAKIPEAGQQIAIAYDHIDVPPIQPIVTRINVYSATCACCGERAAGTEPADMPAGSPFGPNIVALAIYMRSRHMVSYERLAEMLADVTGLDISEGAIANMLQRSSKPFAAEAERIGAVVRAAPVVCSDETSARVRRGGKAKTEDGGLKMEDGNNGDHPKL